MQLASMLASALEKSKRIAWYIEIYGRLFPCCHCYNYVNDNYKK
jgi:hypothetical protein